MAIRRDVAGRRVAYVSAAAGLGQVAPHVAGLDALLLDGTFWSSDELSAGGLSQHRAEDMAHLPVGGPRGSLAATPRLPAKRRIYTHLNNTNPMLRAGSPERLAVEAAGWQVAWDGLELDLGG